MTNYALITLVLIASGAFTYGMIAFACWFGAFVHRKYDEGDDQYIDRI